MDSDCKFPENEPTTAYRKGCRCRRCKDANNAWQKSYHRRSPGKAVGYVRKRKYGISPDQFNALLESQGFACAICGDADCKFALDHCHDTKVIRGILCHRCNTAIGLLKHDPSRCLAAREYLEASEQYNFLWRLLGDITGVAGR